MAITTLDQAAAGGQPPWAFAKGVTPTLVGGRPHSLWYLGGFPGAGSAPGATTAGGTALTQATYGAVAGALPHNDPSGGLVTELLKLSAMATQPGQLILADRLLHCGAQSSAAAISLTVTSAQTINTATLPARDSNGATAGAGVMCGVEVSTVTGAGTPTLTLGYTNSAATASRSSTNIDPTVATSAVGAFYRMGLQAGDVGIQSIQSLTLSATWTSGALALVLYRHLASLELTAANVPNVIDWLTSGAPRLYNGCCPFLIFVPSTTTAANVSGNYVETQG